METINQEEIFYCQETIGGWRQVAVFSGTYEECLEFCEDQNGQYYIVPESEYEVDYL